MLQGTKVTGRSVLLHVRRNNVLEDSHRQLTKYKGKDLLGRMQISFLGEEGIKMGGLTRDWYTSVVHPLFDPNYALFAPTTFGRSYILDCRSVANPNSFVYFELAGRIIARALLDKCLLDAHLSQGFLRQPLGLRATLREI
jgi:E3 ubiquitin-protein ligase HUWE1